MHRPLYNGASFRSRPLLAVRQNSPKDVSEESWSPVLEPEVVRTFQFAGSQDRDTCQNK